jgi:hypothetical protein
MKEQLDKQHRDQDRVRIIKAAIQSGYTFTTDQVVELVRVQRYGTARNQTAILLHPKCTDKELYTSKVLPEFKYKEDLDEVKEALKL